MNNSEFYIHQIKERLSKLDTYLVVLFGSYAYGIPHKDSDLDLLVVTNSTEMPKTYKQKMDLYMYVSQQILDIQKEIPIDLLVFTIPMYDKFVALQSSFSKEIIKKGVLIYEANHTAMA